jgi:Shikimate dehydrogenase substrate binding domain
MPHKESLAAHVDELIGAAALVGAVNVVRRESDGRLVAPTPTGRASSSGCVRPATSWPGGGCY